MSDTVPVPKWILRGIGFTALLLLYTSTLLTITATQFTSPQAQIQAQGTAKDCTYNQIENTTTYTLVYQNQTQGTGTFPGELIYGDTVHIIQYTDSLNIPILYKPRTWTTIYRNTEPIQTTENHTRLLIHLAVWGTIITTIITLKSYSTYKKRTK